jgi:hypothetical protein
VGFHETDEHRALRETVGAIAGEFGGRALRGESRGGIGLATQYGLVPCWGFARLLQIAR